MMKYEGRQFSGRRVLITGAGGPAGYSVLERLVAWCPSLVLHAADASPLASGLFIVPKCRRHIIPMGADPAFVDHLAAVCRRHSIDLVIPTVDTELLPLARSVGWLRSRGTRVAVSPPAGLEVCRDKVALTRALDHVVPTAHTIAWMGQPLPPELSARRLVAKPRSGSGGRGVRIIDDVADLASLPVDGSYMVMQHLPGPEYSVDVFRTSDGRVLVAVPRERLRVDSGVAIAARTVHDRELERFAARAVERLDLTGTVNIQFRRDAGGRPRLLEINPRFPGTMPLTIAAGADMPRFAVLDAFGASHDLEPVEFEEVAIVRRWREQIVDARCLVPDREPTSATFVEAAE